MYEQVNFRNRRFLHILKTIYSAFWIWMALSPNSRSDWFLENLLIWATVLFMGVTYRWFTFSNLSYLLLTVFLALHTLGAHFSYRISGLDTMLHFISSVPRDNFDRIVHTSFGLLLAYPIKEYFTRFIHMKESWTYFMTVMMVVACGAFYELIEMWVAQIVAPEIGVLFLGTQGDPWDTQHDIEVAMYGALIAMLICFIVERRSMPFKK
jgi:putative membrane protein